MCVCNPRYFSKLISSQNIYFRTWDTLKLLFCDYLGLRNVRYIGNENFIPWLTQHNLEHSNCIAFAKLFELFWVLEKLWSLCLILLEKLFREQWRKFRNFSSPFAMSFEPRSVYRNKFATLAILVLEVSPSIYPTLLKLTILTQPPLCIIIIIIISIILFHFLISSLSLKTHTPLFLPPFLSLNPANDHHRRPPAYFSGHRNIFRPKIFSFTIL